jgi:ribonuclease P protein component
LHLPKHLHLRSSGEFRRVYAHGKRYEGSLMVAFILPNDLQHHRFGITASRKAIGNAVERNRSKRLIREVFRQSQATVEDIKVKYDWVFNARRALLNVKSVAALEEFQRILARVRSDELTASRIKPSGLNQ